MKKYVIILSVLCGVCFVQSAHAQKWGVKSNILYDATTSMNIGVEFALSERWTFDMSGNYNPWTFAENKKWKHWFVQPEVRYWTCKRFGGHFLAAHLWGGEYNVGNISGIPDFLGTKFSNLKEYRYEGWFTGIGIAYGYAWMLGKHWNLEASVGVGYLYLQSDIYPCPNCGTKKETVKKHYFGPTQAAVSAVYVF